MKFNPLYTGCQESATFVCPGRELQTVASLGLVSPSVVTHGPPTKPDLTEYLVMFFFSY